MATGPRRCHRQHYQGVFLQSRDFDGFGQGLGPFEVTASSDRAHQGG